MAPALAVPSFPPVSQRVGRRRGGIGLKYAALMVSTFGRPACDSLSLVPISCRTRAELVPSANHGAEGEFRRAIACDAGLAVAYAALARTLQIEHKPEEAKAVVARARELA